MTRRVLSVLLPLALLGCPSEPEGIESDDPVLPDPLSDADSDGLTYQEEVAGWTISVNRSGYPQDSRTVQVTSDPNLADSDGDGLTDLEERLNKADPGLADTDGDTLSDFDEVTRWGTSPTQCDTDGDASGDDPDFPAPPNRALFDGAELDLVPDGDRMVPGVGATSPLFADTDGDGFSDYEEFVVSQRDPVIAELPQMVLTPSPYSGLDLSLEVTYESGDTTSEQFDSTLSWEQASDWQVTTTKSLSLAQSFSLRMEVTGSLSVGNNIGAGLDSDTTLTSRTRLGFGYGYGYEVDRSVSRSTSEEYNRFFQRTQSQSHEVTGARVQMLVDVQNTGSRAYLVEGLGLVVYHYNGTSLEPVAFLEPTVDAFTLGPGEWFNGLILTDTGANPTRVASMLKNPERIVLGTAAFDLLDQDGDDFAYVDEQVFERTSALSVEAESGTIDLDVASHVDRDDSGEIVGINVLRTMELAALDVQPIEVTDPLTKETSETLEIEGRTAIFHESTAPVLADLPGGIDRNGTERLMDAPGYPVTGGPGDRRLRSVWLALVERVSDADPEDEVTPIEDLQLLPGDQATLVYGTDNDQDGIIAREEWLAGSSDALLDSDRRPNGYGDGLSDYWELREGWMVQVEGRAPYRVFSDPSRIDSDGDGLNDDEELAAGTDPRAKDTDGDGFSDGGELKSAGAGYDPLVHNEPKAAWVLCELSERQGYYKVTAHSELGQMLIQLWSYEDFNGRVRADYHFYPRPESTPTLVVTDTLIPARVDWALNRPEIRVRVGELGAPVIEVWATCPAPPGP